MGVGVAVTIMVVITLSLLKLTVFPYFTCLLPACPWPYIVVHSYDSDSPAAWTLVPLEDVSSSTAPDAGTLLSKI